MTTMETSFQFYR